MVGIYHNFAKTHNSVINQLKVKKNIIPKYKNITIFPEGEKINPQFISEEDFIIIH
jgi:hypothetical protein